MNLFKGREVELFYQIVANKTVAELQAMLAQDAPQEGPRDVDVDTVIALLESHPKGLCNEEIQKELHTPHEDLKPLLQEAVKLAKVAKRGAGRYMTYYAR